ncbi:excinuclease ABC subunit UvrA [Maridesulfovibrio hydrothermalis]|uniref:UvrABC system protein A n=1 Tax=Maridesulfovibrio hydrothermalis AM13 = DSM 14728 TaxID=1121451 RepID=L0RCT5_9BACT|nr:excinuclease ABC subunit UvrA [Maridesulfovibrio hydrothermalis]CCO23376.1 excinuclease ABC (subunit A) [Maridesulfovibrio hydrothermalis AM13 = DSM 14728]
MTQKVIHIEGARQHNLKDLNLDIPRDELVVVCGPSGSGKSTLSFDIVYAEGQRRYVESLSAYARQFLPQLDKPQVDKIEGLSPAISLEQQSTSRNPRSTVGTVTEIYDFLRVFFARLGLFHCPECGIPIEAQTSDEILDRIMTLEEGTKFMLLAPLIDHQKGTHKDLFKKLKKEGFVRVRVNGQLYTIDDAPDLEKNKKHNIDLVVDRLVIKGDMKKRLADSLELALRYGDESIVVSIIGGEDIFLSTMSTCPSCKISMPKLSPQLFSFNSPQGACQTCSGIGSVEYYEPELLAPNKGLSLKTGAVIPWKSPKMFERYETLFRKLGKKYGFKVDTPLGEFSDKARKALFYGDKELDWEGVVDLLEVGRNLGRIWRDELSRFRQSRPCPACGGARLRPESLAVKVEGVSVFDFCSMSIKKALDWLEELEFNGHDLLIAEPLLKELTHRLGFMVNVGLDYLNLGRNMATLSGGEAQRIRLAGQLGSGLVGVTYVLDEPSIGLHPRDNERLLKTLRSLQSRGNTVLVVEHDESTIRNADHVIELGPGSGMLGGEIVYQGNVKDLLEKSDSLTAKYMRGELALDKPDERRTPQEWITLKGVQTNNLKNLDVEIPLGVLCCFTGVSGSGKSSLVVDSMYKHIALSRGVKVDQPGRIAGIDGIDKIEKVISIDQSPIGRTPRSNPATYTKIFDEIRKIFCATKEARKRGYKPGRFSFNVRGGRCEACRGDGQIRVEMHFLPDVYVTCDVCKGKRYNSQTLEVDYKGRNIAEVLDMTVRQAKAFFENHVTLKRRLEVLEQVGLEYLQLGQPGTTLSGGEAQRIKISRELGKRSLPGTLYILDEPTTGLHMHEVGKLIKVLQQLVEKGATVIVIEHNTDVIRASDYVFDLGPGGGESGGRIVAKGTPEEIIANPDSVTGTFLV